MEIRTIIKYFKIDINIPYIKQDTILIAKIINKVYKLHTLTRFV